MRFRYYITDLHAGAVLGTNDSGVADDFRHSEDHFVVDAEAGKWLTPDEEVDIADIKD